jgi:Fe-S-cluster containining protein
MVPFDAHRARGRDDGTAAHTNWVAFMRPRGTRPRRAFTSISRKFENARKRSMDRQSAFSYRCNQCGRCCHDQAITLSPVDVIAMARSSGISTGETVARYTMRRGSLLRFGTDGGCAALDGSRCSIHSGRPLACRLYPLGLERDGARERFIRLEAAAGSTGLYGDDGTIDAFLAGQGIDTHLVLNERYPPLIRVLGERVAMLVNFEALNHGNSGGGQSRRHCGRRTSTTIELSMRSSMRTAQDALAIRSQRRSRRTYRCCMRLRSGMLMHRRSLWRRCS